MLWQGEEPEGGTKPFGSITEKGAGLLVRFLVFFFLFLYLSWLLMKNGQVFLAYKTWHRVMGGLLIDGDVVVGWIWSWRHGGEQEMEMNERKKKINVKKYFKVWLRLKPMRESTVWILDELVTVWKEVEKCKHRDWQYRCQSQEGLFLLYRRRGSI